jgi:large exoprotein involved in heme utilization and adhesion
VSGNVNISGNKENIYSGISSTAGLGTEGNGGNTNINTGSLTLSDGAKIEGATFGKGNAGTITVNAIDFITITDTNKNYNAATGKYDNATRLSVESQSPTGTAGDIILTSPKITVDGGAIVATSDSGNGGNIKIGDKSASSQNGIFNLSEVKLLILRNSGLISTTAGGTDRTSGNGGNITINAPQGFIVTAPNENSDITANAFSGSGGKVTINTQQNFWLSSLSRAELELRLGTTDPNLLNPFSLQTNDITAISQLNPNLNGQVTITPP